MRACKKKIDLFPLWVALTVVAVFTVAWFLPKNTAPARSESHGVFFLPCPDGSMLPVRF